MSGFTIVELLIVIVVIAILAAISIAAYSGIQQRANDSAVRNDLSNLAKKQELFRIDDASSLYAVGNTSPLSFDIKISKSAYDTSPAISYNLLICTNSSAPGSDYAFLAISKSGKRLYVSSQSSGVQEYTGATVWGEVTACSSVLPSSGGNGAAYGGGVWRAWAG